MFIGDDGEFYTGNGPEEYIKSPDEQNIVYGSGIDGEITADDFSDMMESL